MTRRPILREITVFLGFFVLTAIMTWPWILHLRDAVSDKGDPYLHTYFIWWDYHQTVHDPLNLFNATIFYPYQNTLAFSENDYGIAVPFFPLYALGFRPVTVLSLATLVAFAFSGYGMFRLTRTLTGSNGAAWVAGIVFAFLPYHFQRLPHLPLIFAGWIPLMLEALVLFARRRTWARAGWLGFAFLMNALTCVVWFTLTLVPFALSAIFLLWWCRLARDRAFWLRGGVALGIALLAVSAFLYPYYSVHKMFGFARSAADAVALSARPINWLAVSERNKFWKGLGGAAATDELSLFPGLLPPLLALGALFLVSPISKYPAIKLPKIGVLLPRRVLLVVLDLLSLEFLLIALLTKGYGRFRFQLFGFELLRNSSPTRPLIFFLITVCIRFVIAPPEIIRRIKGEKNFFASFRSNPRSVALLLGLIWVFTGFFGSFGMHFAFHRFLFAVVLPFRSIRVPARWAMICYVGMAILAGWGAVQVAKVIVRWQPRVPRTLVYAVLIILMLFEQRVAPIQFAHGDVDPDALTLRLKQTPMSGGLVELPAEKDNYAYHYYVMRAAYHGRPIITASSSFSPPFVQQIESLTLARPIPDSFIDLMETIPASYLVVHNSLLAPDSRQAIEVLISRGIAAGRIRFINSYGNPRAPDDLYAITRTEPNAQTETPQRVSASYSFVRQQYLDILHREPEPVESEKSTALINDCQGERTCVLERRIREDLGLIHSREFKDTGGFVYRLYQAALGRAPKYAEWEHDYQLIAAAGKNRVSFAEEWTARPEFLNHYPAALSNSEYVDKLLQASGQEPGQTDGRALIENLSQGKLTRAGVLLSVAGSSSAKRDDDEAFVTLCYFIYLKRDPDPEGHNYWLQTLRSQPQGETALILGFRNSGEYRGRFGLP